MFARLIWFTYFFRGGVRVGGNSVDFRHKFNCFIQKKQEYKIVEDDN